MWYVFVQLCLSNQYFFASISPGIVKGRCESLPLVPIPEMGGFCCPWGGFEWATLAAEDALQK